MLRRQHEFSAARLRICKWAAAKTWWTLLSCCSRRHIRATCRRHAARARWLQQVRCHRPRRQPPADCCSAHTWHRCTPPTPHCCNRYCLQTRNATQRAWRRHFSINQSSLLCPRHDRVGGIMRWCASNVRLSRIPGLDREQRGLGRLKLAQRSPRHTWLGHQFQGQKVKGQLTGGILWRPPVQLVSDKSPQLKLNRTMPI